MNTNLKKTPTLAEVLSERLTDAELDRILAERHDEVESLLDEARKAKSEGQYASLEPLHEFLRRARERLGASR